MYKSGDKFVIELKESLFNPEDLFSKTKFWTIRKIKDFIINEESLSELGRFDEGVWLKTFDELRDENFNLKMKIKTLEEENKQKNMEIAGLKGELNER